MWHNFHLLPVQASTFAKQVDHLYFTLVGLSVFFAALIFLLVFVFAIKYRRRSDDERPRAILGDLRLELAWTLIPMALSVGVFVWATSLFFSVYSPPANAMNVYVVAKQWMWKLQHQEGKREINELHIPVDQPVRVVMTSEDVIHSFFIPAFRVKQDVVPGRYTSIWFEATKIGVYHLFCSQYCGTEHSGMIGRVIVMSPADYEAWLGGGGGEAMDVAGQRVFETVGCSNCHKANGTGRGPSLRGVFGKKVTLNNGQTVVANEAYIRESILEPRAKIVKGYKPIMPTFTGVLDEQRVLQLIAYVKSLR